MYNIKLHQKTMAQLEAQDPHKVYALNPQAMTLIYQRLSNGWKNKK